MSSDGCLTIALAKFTRLPGWIFEEVNVLLYPTKLGNQGVKALFLPDGEIISGRANDFHVYRPRRINWFFTIPLVRVLEAYRNGEVLWRNHHLCLLCAANSGEVVATRPSGNYGASCPDVDMKCRQCGALWTIDNYPYGVRL